MSRTLEFEMWRWLLGALVMTLGIVLPIVLMAHRNRNALFAGVKKR